MLCMFLLTITTGVYLASKALHRFDYICMNDIKLKYGESDTYLKKNSQCTNIKVLGKKFTLELSKLSTGQCLKSSEAKNKSSIPHSTKPNSK